MAIISQIGRRSPGVRLLIAGIYAVLLLGAVTMIYPFLIMVSGSMRSAVDLRETALVPGFLRSDAALYRKYIEALFNESVDVMNSVYDESVPSFEHVSPPESPNRRFAAEWLAFMEDSRLPDYFTACGAMAADISKTIPQGLREFKRHVAGPHGAGIDEVNAALGTDFVGWSAFFVIPENYAPRIRMPQNTPLAAALNEFKRCQPRGNVFCHSPEGFFKRQYVTSVYSRDIVNYNKAHGTGYRSYEELHLSETLPEGSMLEGNDWETFVRGNLNLLWVRADDRALPLYRAFLKAKYRDIAVLNRAYETSYESFSDIPLITEPPFEGLALSDWAALVTGWQDPDTGREYRIPAGHLRVHSVEFLFREYLRTKYGDVGALNAECGTAFRNFMDVVPPQKDAHYFSFLDSRKELRWEFATRNYKTVLEYLLFHGRGILNTAIYCTLAVFFALLVNPLAAYALSRYRMPQPTRFSCFS